MKIEDILSSLPTRDELAKVVGMEARNGAHADVLPMLGIFGTGMLLGAGLALLFAPKAGEELRRDIAGTLNDVGERIAKADHTSESEAEPTA